jgi:membrane-bound lytic murein transglycosylase D
MRIRWNGYRLAGLAVLMFCLARCDPSQATDAAESLPLPATPPEIAAPTASAAQAAPPAPAPLTPAEQRVRVLIQQVEQAYSYGEQAYKKGNLVEAKAEFDRAVDLMLSSGLDIKSNEKLQEEFDRVVDGVNAMEMEALKQGNGFVPNVEPTPADVASDVTFEVDPNIVAKAKTELATTKSDLPLMVNDYVASYINFFANSQRGHNTLLHSFQRSGRYRAMIQRVMAEEGVPQDLIYLAVAESGFQPRALNGKSGAGGMWQFMPHGDYGLVRNAYVDERFDPEKSTRAYARYMKFIYNQLGDWYLSMAAYDWGAGNVQRAVQKTGYADFWELYKRNNLPGETKNYVPEILAAIIIANHPTQYGFDDFTLDPPVLTDTITINYSTDLKLVSDIVGAPIDEVMALNPSLLRQVTPPDTSFDLHLPAGTATLFERRIETIPEGKRNTWRYHRVTAEDTLASVAREYHVGVGELAAANQLREIDNIQGVEALAVPVAPAVAVSTRMALYTARRGDTLVTIADRFGVSLNELRSWNKITGVKVEAGRRLHVAEPSSAARTSTAHRRGAAATNRQAASEDRPAPANGKAHPLEKSKDAARRSGQVAATHTAAKKTGAANSKTSTMTGAGNSPSSKRSSKTKTARKKKQS